jgi:hypothetical protein
MSMEKSGHRYPLLFYRRTMDRVWVYSFILGTILITVWGWSQFGKLPLLKMNADLRVFIGAVVSFSISIFSFLSRYMAYVQVHPSYLKIATPFLRLKISFCRMKSIHPALVQQLFPTKEAGWSQRSFLEPLYGKTAIVFELNGYPLDPILLRFFLPVQMFSPASTGLVILVNDWMQLSTEFDSFFGAWLQLQGRSRAKNH